VHVSIPPSPVRIPPDATNCNHPSPYGRGVGSLCAGGFGHRLLIIFLLCAKIISTCDPASATSIPHFLGLDVRNAACCVVRHIVSCCNGCVEKVRDLVYRLRHSNPSRRYKLQPPQSIRTWGGQFVRRGFAPAFSFTSFMRRQGGARRQASCFFSAYVVMYRRSFLL
jgi:hypothetical protein